MGYLTVTAVLGDEPDYQDALARFEPMAIGAIGEVSRYWTATEMNTLSLPLEGNLLINRLITLGWSALFLGIAWARFSMTERASSRWRQRRMAKQASRAAAGDLARPAAPAAAAPRRFDAGHALRTFLSRLKLETLIVLKSPGLIVLLLIALGFTAFTLSLSQTAYGTPSYPLTANVINSVLGGVTLFNLIIAVFYGGELVWRERDVKINEIIDAAPAPAWAIFVPKILAVFLVLLMMSLAGMAAGVIYQLVLGAEHIDIGLYFTAYIIPQSIDLLMIAILSVFLQVLSPSKYVGWGLLLVWFVSRILLSNLGYTNMLYSFGGGPGEPLSDMNGTGGFWVGGMIARVYWACFGVLLLVFSHWAWPRGTVVAVWPRLKNIRQRVTLASGGVAVAAIAGMIGTGVVIYQNIKVLNTYQTSDEREKLAADYERKYLKYAGLPRPVVTDVAFDVAIYPDERRMETTGYYLLRNDSGVPIRELHVREGDDGMTYSRLDIAGAKLAVNDEKFDHRIYRFDTPLAPGATTRLDFQSQIWRRGFANGPAATDIVDNGTFVNNLTFAPIIGMDQRSLLQDRTVRRRQGLPDELRTAKLEDTKAQRENYIHADWVNSRITISTAADQVPIAPGNKVSDVVKDGRRIAVFESPRRFSISSRCNRRAMPWLRTKPGTCNLASITIPSTTGTCPRCSRR
jgi:ABC-type transport system involved in multi-copper enzyme maturation permease subunit